MIWLLGFLSSRIKLSCCSLLKFTCLSFILALSFLSSLCPIQFGPAIDKATGKNNSEFKTPSTIRIDTVLKKALNMNDSQKYIKLMPINVENAELKMGNPMLTTAFKARSSRFSPAPETNACIIWALKSTQKPTDMMTIIIVIELSDRDIKYMEPTMPSMIDSIVRMIISADTRSGIKINAMMNMTWTEMTNVWTIFGKVLSNCS